MGEHNGPIVSYATDPRGKPFKKKPLDACLLSGPKGTADDVRVQTGYTVWTLIAQWQTANYDDDLLLAGYSDMPCEEWEAAKRYYLAHKPFIDARIVINSQPADDDDIPPLRTADEYFAFLSSQADTSARE